MSTETLEEIKGKLYKAFNEAIAKADFSRTDAFSYPDGANAVAATLTAAAEAAKSIALIEREQREAKEQGKGLSLKPL